MKKRVPKSFEDFMGETKATLDELGELDHNDGEALKKFSEDLGVVVDEINAKLEKEELTLDDYALKNKIQLLEKTKKIVDALLKLLLDGQGSAKLWESLSQLLKIQSDAIAHIERNIPMKEEMLPAIPGQLQGTVENHTTNILVMSNQDILDGLIEKRLGGILGDKKKVDRVDEFDSTVLDANGHSLHQKNND